MTTTPTHRFVIAVLAGSLLGAPLTAASADGAGTPCGANPGQHTQRAITQTLEAPAEAGRARVWAAAQRDYSAEVARGAMQRHREIAETVAARSRAAAADGMLQLAAVPGSAIHAADAQPPVRRPADTERAPQQSPQTTLASAQPAGQSCP